VTAKWPGRLGAKVRKSSPQVICSAARAGASDPMRWRIRGPERWPISRHNTFRRPCWRANWGWHAALQHGLRPPESRRWEFSRMRSCPERKLSPTIDGTGFNCPGGPASGSTCAYGERVKVHALACLSGYLVPALGIRGDCRGPIGQPNQ
jgi:hypothetical protein